MIDQKKIRGDDNFTQNQDSNYINKLWIKDKMIISKYTMRDLKCLYKCKVIKQGIIFSNQRIIEIYQQFILLYQNEKILKPKAIMMYSDDLKIQWIFQDQYDEQLKILDNLKSALFILNEQTCLISGDAHTISKIKEHIQLYVKQMDFYTFYHGIRRIGQGSFANVWLANSLTNQENVAVKIILKKNSNNKNQEQLIKNEIKIMRQIQHDELIQLYEVFESKTQFFIVMNYLKGNSLIILFYCQIYVYNFNFLIMQHFEGYNLHDVMKKKITLDLNVVQLILTSLLRGLDYLHDKGIIHRDIKLSNIILDEEIWITKSPNCTHLTDFGLSVFEHEEKQYIQCGTPGYMAPEQFNSINYDKSIDIFSVGIVFHELQFINFILYF